MKETEFTKITNHLLKISEWQTDHERADEKRHNDFPEMIKEAVEIQINGNLRDIKKHLTEQDLKLIDVSKKIDTLKNETEPIIDSKNTIINLRRFLLWVAPSVAIIWAFFQYFSRQ